MKSHCCISLVGYDLWIRSVDTFNIMSGVWTSVASLNQSSTLHFSFIDHTRCIVVVNVNNDNSSSCCSLERYNDWNNIWYDISVEHPKIINKLHQTASIIGTIPGVCYIFVSGQFVVKYNTLTKTLIELDQINRLPNGIFTFGQPYIYDSYRRIIWILTTTTISAFSSETDTWLPKYDIEIETSFENVFDLCNTFYLCLFGENNHYISIVSAHYIHCFNLNDKKWTPRINVSPSFFSMVLGVSPVPNNDEFVAWHRSTLTSPITESTYSITENNVLSKINLTYINKLNRHSNNLITL